MGAGSSKPISQSGRFAHQAGLKNLNDTCIVTQLTRVTILELHVLTTLKCFKIGIINT